MAQVSIKINGYAYTVGCEDGQEEHLQAMAAEIERRIAGIKALGGQSGEARLLLLAALLMADELHDLSAEMRASRAAVAAGAPQGAFGGAFGTAPDPAPRADPALGRRLNELAERAEEIAAALERA